MEELIGEESFVIESELQMAPLLPGTAEQKLIHPSHRQRDAMRAASLVVSSERMVCRSLPDLLEVVDEKLNSPIGLQHLEAAWLLRCYLDHRVPGVIAFVAV